MGILLYMNPETSTDPAAPAPKNNRTKLLVAIGAGIIIIILAIVGFLLLTGDPNSATGGTQSKQFKNWLEPTSEIKVGNHRYISACQVLPKQGVEATFGKLSPKTVIQEKYLDESVREADQPLRIDCRYNHGIGKGQDVSLETEQYVDAAEVKEINHTLGSFDNEEIEQNLTVFKKAADGSDNQAAKDFVSKLEKSYDTYKKYSQEFNDDKLRALDVCSLVLPVSGSITGALNDFVFVGAYNNTTYTLGHTPSSDKGDVTKYSDAELVSELVAMKKATETITSNMKDRSLDQSPAPTILGNTDKYGSTTILEPCAIMSASVFNQMTGKSQSKPVDRTTASIDFTTKRTTVQDKRLILPSNKCTRQSSMAVGDFDSENTYASLDLTYGSSTKQAEAWLNDGFKIDPGDTPLQTKADWAVSFVNPVNPDDAPVVMFRTGPYIGHLQIYTRTADEQVIEGSKAQYTQAIDALVPRIKQHAANAN